jgi:hypothetical protein
MITHLPVHTEPWQNDHRKDHGTKIIHSLINFAEGLIVWVFILKSQSHCDHPALLYTSASSAISHRRMYEEIPHCKKKDGVVLPTSPHEYRKRHASMGGLDALWFPHI